MSRRARASRSEPSWARSRLERASLSLVSSVARSSFSGAIASSTSTSARFSANCRYPSAWAKRTISDSERYSRSSVGSSSASTGSWLARIPIEPRAVWVESISTSSLNTSPSGVRTSTGNFVCATMISSADLRPRALSYRPGSIRPRLTARPSASFLGCLHDFLDLALEEERALGHLVVLALDDLLKAPDRVRDRDVCAWRAREFFGHEEGLREEALDLARALHRQLVLVGELVDAEDRDDVLQLLVALQDLLDRVGDPEVVLAEDLRLEDRRGRVQRVHGRVDAFLGDRAREHGGRVQVREHRRRRRIGEVVGGHVDRLHRGDRALARGGDPLLQLAHLGLERGLVADLRGHPPEQRRDLGAGLHEAEDVVDEQQHVLALVAEVLGHRQTR